MIIENFNMSLIAPSKTSFFVRESNNQIPLQQLRDIRFHKDRLHSARSIRANSTFLAIWPKRKTVASDASTRSYCQESGPPASSPKLPPLMDFPSIVWPSVLKSLKNLIFTTFIIKPYMDAEFDLPEFIQGSKKAVEVISHRISEGQDLDDLVTKNIVASLKDKVSQMTVSQRSLIPIEVGDIYFTFPYQIGIIFNQDNPDLQKRFVEITMVYHVLKGLAAMRSNGEEPPLNLGMLPEYQGKISICNYRFIKEFTKGVESDWTVNLLNHFRPVDEEKTF